MTSRPGFFVAKLLLAANTVVAMLSYGGLLIFVFLPLAAGSWWAVRNSRGPERAGWTALSALAGAQWAWEITYPVTEGDTPASGIIAVVAGMLTAALLLLGSQYRLTREDPA